MAAATALGEFLRARRSILDPQAFGIGIGSRRRVRGLRREEVAGLAGISTDYYVRIEQGRVAQPSDQVLSALARVLQLDPAAHAHLVALARPDESSAESDELLVPDGAPALLDEVGVPAYIADRYLNCLASNALARALSPGFRPGVNLLRRLLLDPSERRLYVDWEAAVASAVGGVREAAETSGDDARLADLVEQLSAASEEFAELWAGAPIGYRPSGDVALVHPVVGVMQLRRFRFDLPGSRAHLHMYGASPDDSDAIRRLTAAQPAG